jgi:hypothetical protein
MKKQYLNEMIYAKKYFPAILFYDGSAATAASYSTTSNSFGAIVKIGVNTNSICCGKILSTTTPISRKVRYTLIFFFVAFTWIKSFGQTPVTFGITAGLNLPYLGGGFELGGVKKNSVKVYPSYHLGISVTKKLNEKMDVNSGLVWSGQGYEVGDPKVELKERDFYFNVPLVAGFTVSPIVTFKFGPQFGLLANAKVKLPKATEDVTALLRPFDFSLVAGISIALSQDLKINGNYNFGLTNTLDGFNNKYYYPNRVVQLGLTYVFKRTNSKADEKF